MKNIQYLMDLTSQTHFSNIGTKMMKQAALGKELINLYSNYITREYKEDIEPEDVFKKNPLIPYGRGYVIRKDKIQEFYDKFTAIYENRYWDHIDRHNISYSPVGHLNVYTNAWNKVKGKRRLPSFDILLSLWKKIRATIPVAYIVLHNFEKFLAVLVKGRKGMMNLPGGKMESSDKDLFETARRETKEELGLDIISYDNVYQYGDVKIVAAYEVVSEQLPIHMRYSREIDGHVYIPWSVLHTPMIRTKFGPDKLKLLDMMYESIQSSDNYT